MTGRPNALERLIARFIARDGPMTIERYWDLALFHPEHGYYASRDPFGAAGDFVTAPEVSQMFGELLGAWIAAAWRDLGAPSAFVFAEMGPGRGTLMADMLRTLRRIDVDCLKAARVALVEVSDRLAGLQAERLAPLDLPIRHVKRLADVGSGPLLLVANELFDAVAIRQFVPAQDGWRERRVGLDGNGRLRFVVADAGETPRSPIGTAVSGGAVREASPQRLALADAVAARIVADGGAALVIDYGHGGGTGDTLQAVKDHAFADPLTDPGEADITSHVDFAALRRRFDAAGASVAPLMDQGAFLLRLGLAERAGALGRAGSAEQREAVRAAAQRLAGQGAGEMGSLFKVLCAASRPLSLPPFPPFAVD